MKPLSTAILVLVIPLLTPAPLWGQDRPTPSVSIHAAALNGDVDVIREHIAAGSDLNERDPWGSTPLVIAITFDHVEAARALIEAGADLTLPGSDGATPLHIAAFLGRTEIVRALLEAGADRQALDDGGSTPLDAVTPPFDEVRGVYDAVGAGLAPLGLRLDTDRIRAARPHVAEMLRPRPEALAAVDYTPQPGSDWSVSTPAEQGLDPMLVAELFYHAAEMEALYGLLIVKNGYLVAEGYFNEGSMEQPALLQSATKSFYSALVGIALELGCLSSLDQTMIEFFPELATRTTDPRKAQITIRDLLRMRSGYPWEESDPSYWEAFVSGELLPLLVDFPLVSDPGTEFHYSNLTTYLLGVIVARACETDLRSFAQEHLFSPLEAEIGDWWQDGHGYYHAFFHATARTAAKFGLLYLDDGEYAGNQVLPAEWVRDSLQRYSTGMYDNEWRSDASNTLSPYLRDVGYGYQWWSARVGSHHLDFAWGHGGQLIVLVDALDMVMVVTSDPFFLQHDDESWRHERANFNLVGRFIGSLPADSAASGP